MQRLFKQAPCAEKYWLQAFLVSSAIGLQLAASGASLSAQTPETLTIHIRDFLTMPITGDVASTGSNTSLLARESVLRQEPGGARRIFISDLNGQLYILDNQTKKLTTYLDLNGNKKPGIFHKLTTERGFGNGFSNFIFDPDYAHNGKFYTIHIEDPSLPGSNLPDNTNFPGLRLTGYTVTPAIEKPGPTMREGVLVEWTDANPSDSKFEGTAREIMRVQIGTVSHPMGDMIFNPTAKPGNPDWRVMYMSVGEGAAGESKDAMIRHTPQRLDVVIGKILRIIPDPGLDVKTSSISDNGRYRIPNDNPFTKLEGARKEIWAYGFRNPQRMSWYVDPRDSSRSSLLVGVIGLHTWEWVDIVHRGANYGYSLREGNEQLNADNKTSPIPADDKIPIEITDTKTVGMVTPTYPVIVYPHNSTGGDAIANGYVYSGKIKALQGKFIFGDITTGKIWYANYADMLAADDGNPGTVAPIHQVNIVWDGSNDPTKVYDSMYPIGTIAYHARGGVATPEGIPGRATISGGRVDIRFGVDAEDNIYILSKVDGTVREIVSADSK